MHYSYPWGLVLGPLKALGSGIGREHCLANLDAATRWPLRDRLAIEQVVAAAGAVAVEEVCLGSGAAPRAS